MHYLTGVYWNRGSVAVHNQDSLILQQVLTGRGRILLAAVCDGMGGLQQGETASGYMAENLQEWFYGYLMRAVYKKKPYWMIRRSVDRLVYHVQEQLRQYGTKEQCDLGTTMSVLVLWEHTYLIWHLGDSRIYYIHRTKYRRNKPRSGKDKLKPHRDRQGGKETIAECMTKDHAMGRNRLTKCVGSFGFYRPDYRMGMVKEGEAFLLCSDGLWHCVTDQELAAVLSPKQMREETQAERRLREIGDACMKRGERDNLSAVYVKLMQ